MSYGALSVGLVHENLAQDHKAIVAWKAVRSNTRDRFGYVIRCLVENLVCEGCY